MQRRSFRVCMCIAISYSQKERHRGRERNQHLVSEPYTYYGISSSSDITALLNHRRNFKDYKECSQRPYKLYNTTHNYTYIDTFNNNNNHTYKLHPRKTLLVHCIPYNFFLLRDTAIFASTKQQQRHNKIYWRWQNWHVKQRVCYNDGSINII